MVGLVKSVGSESSTGPGTGQLTVASATRWLPFPKPVRKGQLAADPSGRGTSALSGCPPRIYVPLLWPCGGDLHNQPPYYNRSRTLGSLCRLLEREERGRERDSRREETERRTATEFGEMTAQHRTSTQIGAGGHICFCSCHPLLAFDANPLSTGQTMNGFTLLGGQVRVQLDSFHAIQSVSSSQDCPALPIGLAWCA